jgi:hypothetical protein
MPSLTWKEVRMRKKPLFVGIAAIFLFAIAAIGERTNKVLPEDNVSHFKMSGKAGIPHQINYQGYLTDGYDNAITDTLEMTLRIYDTSLGGTELWSETQSSVSVVDGLFNVLLGSVNEIPSSVFSNSACWLQIEIEGEILSPRKQIASVGYAFRADTADFAVAASTDNDWQVVGNDMYSIPTGNVGIGTDEPQTTLDIYDSNAPAEITLRTGLLGGSNAINFTAGNWAIRSVLTVPPMALSFLYGSDEIMTLQGENVGIGTVNPTEKLDVNGNVIVRGDALEVVGGAGSYIKIGTESEGYATTFSYESDTSSGMYDTYIRNPCGRGVGCDLILDFPCGNVGIGTPTPTEKLDVTGTVQMTGFNMPTGAADGYVLTSDSAGVGTWQALAADGMSGNGTANYIPKFTDTTTLGNSVIYETDGNIGIGTTDPSGAKLRVAGGLMVTNNSSLMFETGHTANVMKILNQNVGIGTINPQGYKLYVNGKAAAPSGWYSQYFKSYSGNYLYIDAGDNGTDITIRPSDGNVGIGTTGPAKKLHVYAGSSGASTYAATNLIIEDDASEYLSFLTPNTSNVGILFADPQEDEQGRIDYMHTSDILRIWANNGSTQINLDGANGEVEITGNVGIGTTDPQNYKFALNEGDGVIAGGKLRIQTANLEGTGGYYTEINGNEIRGGGVAGPGSNPIHIKPGDNQSAVLLAEEGGKVGIGTTSPNDYLDVYGRVRARHRGITYAGFIVADTAGTFKGGFVLNGTIGPSIYADGQGYVVNVRNDNGNVGIGTTTPNYKLDVAGDINTSGDVRKNGTAYNNPDYVFEPEYELMSLKELKEFITENKHLPNMPSTDEVRKKGVKIFEQNRMLLEKLEEAYLYIIELEERITKLENAEQKCSVEH